MFYCRVLNEANGTCSEWAEAVNPFLPALSAQEGRDLGVQILGLFAIAFAMRLTRNLILNRN